MKLLAIDTATEACSVALDLDGRRLQLLERSGREHSRRLPKMLRQLMSEAGLGPSALDGLVCGVGPGSFAGVRIGVACVKGLALGLELPVTGVSSLAMLAQGAVRAHGAERVLAAIDARMDEVYFGEYRRIAGQARRVGDELVCRPGRVAVAGPGPYIAAGSGWGAHGRTLAGTLGAGTRLTSVDAEALPQAVDALALVQGMELRDFVAANELQPSYLRNRVALTRAERDAARAVPRTGKP